MAAHVSEDLIAGYYRTHVGARPRLRQEDVVSIRERFQDPSNVFLIIRPGGDTLARASFFFWQGNSIRGDFSSSFPLSIEELQSIKETQRFGALRRGGRNAIRDLTFSRYKQLPRRFLGIFAVLAGLLLLLTAAVFFRWGHPSGFLQSGRPVSGAFSALGLKAQRNGSALAIGWDRSAPEIAAAKEGRLFISDLGQRTSVPLNPVQLRTGSVSYTASGERIEVRLDVVGASGKQSTESMISISRSPDASIANTALPPGPIERELNAALPPPEPARLKPPGIENGGLSARPRPARQVSRKAGASQVARLPSRPSSTGVRERAATPALQAIAPAAAQTVLPHAEEAPAKRLTQAPQLPASAQLKPEPRPAIPGNAAERAQPDPLQAKDESKSHEPGADRQDPAKPPILTGSAPLIRDVGPTLSYVAAKAVRRQQPSAPPELRQLILGDNVVEIAVRIDEFGRVTSAKPVSTKGSAAKFLTPAVVEAAFGWQFEPAKQNGKAVPCVQNLTFSFHASGR